MISFTIEDVMNVVNAISGYLVAIGVALFLTIVAIVGCRKRKTHEKYLVRAQASGAFLLVLVVIINMICIKMIS